MGVLSLAAGANGDSPTLGAVDDPDTDLYLRSLLQLTSVDHKRPAAVTAMLLRRLLNDVVCGTDGEGTIDYSRLWLAPPLLEKLGETRKAWIVEEKPAGWEDGDANFRKDLERAWVLLAANFVLLEMSRKPINSTRMPLTEVKELKLKFHKLADAVDRHQRQNPGISCPALARELTKYKWEDAVNAHSDLIRDVNDRANLEYYTAARNLVHGDTSSVHNDGCGLLLSGRGCGYYHQHDRIDHHSIGQRFFNWHFDGRFIVSSGTSSSATSSAPVVTGSQAPLSNGPSSSTSAAIIIAIVAVAIVGVSVAVYIFRKWLLPTSKDFKKRRLGTGGAVDEAAAAGNDDDGWAPSDRATVPAGGTSTPDRQHFRDHISNASPLPGQQQPTLPSVGGTGPSVGAASVAGATSDAGGYAVADPNMASGYYTPHQDPYGGQYAQQGHYDPYQAQADPYQQQAAAAAYYQQQQQAQYYAQQPQQAWNGQQ
ncbi:hypothetical protein HK101_010971 [Irineochytrium annulatum]|nr:hypothetical protein HK101_010971 [Irineochytrium annulatum]